MMKMVKRLMLALLILSVASYLGAIGYLKLNETDLVFSREAAPGGYPRAADSLQLPYRTVSFRSSDSVLLSAWEIPASPPGGMRSEERRVGKECRSGWWRGEEYK